MLILAIGAEISFNTKYVWTKIFCYENYAEFYRTINKHATQKQGLRYVKTLVYYISDVVFNGIWLLSDKLLRNLPLAYRRDKNFFVFRYFSRTWAIFKNMGLLLDNR